MASCVERGCKLFDKNYDWPNQARCIAPDGTDFGRFWEMSKDRDYPLGTVCSEQCDDCRTSGTSAEYIYDPMTGAPIESVCQCTVMDII